MSETKNLPIDNGMEDSDDEFPLNELIPEDQKKPKIIPISEEKKQDELFKMHRDEYDDLPNLVNESD
uniref:Intraflagellar transport protein 46 homolog n=1 Tax=Strongyloides papillosus TaxID=174720 RepID=A0A0N5CFR8_STREA